MNKLKHHLHYVGEDRDNLTGRVVLLGTILSHIRMYVLDDQGYTLLVCNLSELEAAQREDREPVPSAWSRVDVFAVEEVA